MIAEDGRHLIDAAGRPFMIHGDSAWSLISGLRREEVEIYLRDRRARGFNSFNVNLIDHTDPLVNAYGEPPFRTDGDFSTPNEAYFAHADHVIERANAMGFLVWLSPIYYGYDGGDEGFYTDVVAAGPSAMRDWGRWVGERYRDVEGLVWVMGGDFVPPPEGLALLDEVVAGIRERDDRHYFAAHWARGIGCAKRCCWRQIRAAGAGLRVRHRGSVSRGLRGPGAAWHRPVSSRAGSRSARRPSRRR
jgi:hypothetical protein